jgi:hypothetical protein
MRSQNLDRFGYFVNNRLHLRVVHYERFSAKFLQVAIDLKFNRHSIQIPEFAWLLSCFDTAYVSRSASSVDAEKPDLQDWTTCEQCSQDAIRNRGEGRIAHA